MHAISTAMNAYMQLSCCVLNWLFPYLLPVTLTHTHIYQKASTVVRLQHDFLRFVCCVTYPSNSSSTLTSHPHFITSFLYDYSPLNPLYHSLPLNILIRLLTNILTSIDIPNRTYISKDSRIVSIYQRKCVTFVFLGLW